MLSNLSKALLGPSVAIGFSTWLTRKYLPVSVTGILLYTSAVGVLVALAATDELTPWSTGLLGKAANGEIVWWKGAFTWPYHTLLWFRIYWRRRRSKEPLWSDVGNGWFIGGWPMSADPKFLPEGPLAVLDCTCELPARHKDVYYQVPMWDTMAPTPQQMKAAVQWALEQREKKLPVYVHCQNGHGRSGAVLGSCLLAAGLAKDYDEAVKLMQAARPKVKLNQRQRAALVDYADKKNKSS